MSPRREFVVVGASLAGGRAVETLRAEGFDGRIRLVGAEPHRPYERPPLSKEVLRGEKPHDVAFLRPEEWYAENDVELILGNPATALDPAARTVALKDGARLSYDAALLATGARPRALPVPGGDLDGVFTLRTIEDALAIGARLGPGVPVVVVGAGFIGMEVAASAAALGCRVSVVEIFATPLERVLGPEVGAIWAEIHRERGIDLRIGRQVARIEGEAGALRVFTDAGETLEAAMVVAGIGVVPETRLAESAGLAVADGIVVDERCRTSAAGVYAAGDVASHPNPSFGRIRVEHWQNAQNQGGAAARAMLGGAEPFAEVPWFWSDQFDLTLQMFGHPGGADRVVFRGDPASRAFAAFYLAGERVVASVGVNRAKDARAVKPLIESGRAVSDGALADEDEDLRALAKG